VATCSFFTSWVFEVFLLEQLGSKNVKMNKKIEICEKFLGKGIVFDIEFRLYNNIKYIGNVYLF